jgi:hypothetical protein
MEYGSSFHNHIFTERKLYSTLYAREPKGEIK